jgi:hypothetical protein
VSVGRDMTGRDVLVNLAAAAGACTVTGSPAPAGQVCARWPPSWPRTPGPTRCA